MQDPTVAHVGARKGGGFSNAAVKRLPGIDIIDLGSPLVPFCSVDVLGFLFELVSSNKSTLIGKGFPGPPYYGSPLLRIFLDASRQRLS